MKIRTASLVLAPAALAVAAALASAGAASAATASPAAAVAVADATAVSPLAGPLAGPFCSGDVCTAAYPTYDGSGDLDVKVWAQNSAFNGHFEVQVPGVAAPYNSPDNDNTLTSPDPADGGYWFLVPNNNGRYTVNAWKESSGGGFLGLFSSPYANIGSVGFNGPVL